MFFSGSGFIFSGGQISQTPLKAIWVRGTSCDFLLPPVYLSGWPLSVFSPIFSFENSPDDYAKFRARHQRKEAHDEMPSYVENKPRDRGGADGTLG